MLKSKFLLIPLVLIQCLMFTERTGLSQAYDAKRIIFESQQSETAQAAKEKQLFDRTVSMVNFRHYIFKAEFGPGSEEVFVIVDSTSSTVQASNRQSLTGRITSYNVKVNDKQQTVSVSIKVHGNIASADVFLSIGPGGKGHANINCDAWSSSPNVGPQADFPGGFIFDGKLIDLNQATYYLGGSHTVH